MSDASLKDSESLERWRNLPQPNAKPQLCPYCKRMFVIVCKDDMHELCGNYLRIKPISS